MTKLMKEKGASGRLHIDTPMMGESLVSKVFLKQTEAKEYFRMHPDINVLKIGGQSIMDRGAKALLPMSILGVLLIFAGGQLALTVIDLRDRKGLFVALMMLGITLASNLAAGFLAGLVIAYLLKSDRLSV